jgi:hypothetical protein
MLMALVPQHKVLASISLPTDLAGEALTEQVVNFLVALKFCGCIETPAAVVAASVFLSVVDVLEVRPR